MKNLAIGADEILLPQVDDMSAWACIACDQFTSEKEYWQEVERFVCGKRTTLDLVLPEIYLDGSEEDRIAKINSNIKEYLNSNVFKS